MAQQKQFVCEARKRD